MGQLGPKTTRTIHEENLVIDSQDKINKLNQDKHIFK